jgi:outer membrane protein assembly factor BamE (lipoprotein component of BamABCDE complex)
MKKLIILIAVLILNNCSTTSHQGYKFEEDIEKIFKSDMVKKSDVLRILGEPSFYSLDKKRFYYVQTNGKYNNTLRFKIKNFDILGFECFKNCCKKMIYKNTKYE